MERIWGKWWAVAMGLISAWGRGEYWRGRGEYWRGRGEYWRGVFPGKQQRVVRVAVGGAVVLSYGYRRR